ncbi:hypothetical protein B1A_05677, partial [mine drainage metagenome]
RLVVVIAIAAKYGQPIRLITTTNGKNVDLSGKNLRIIVKDDVTEIHYAFNKPPGPHTELIPSQLTKDIPKHSWTQMETHTVLNLA